MAIKGDLGQILSGSDIPLKECNIIIKQPTLKEICLFGEDNFLANVNFFTKAEKVVSSIREGNSRLAMLSDFQLLMIIIDEDSLTKKSIIDFFELILPGYRVRFDPGSICFLIEGSEKIVGQLNPMNFLTFQKTLEILFIPKSILKENEPDYNPANDKAAEIAAKLKKGRQIREEMTADQGKSSGSLFGDWTSILSVGLGISIQDLFQYTPFQLYDAYKRYQKKLAYDLYQKVSTTPMMDVSKMEEPDNWMEGLYN